MRTCPIRAFAVATMIVVATSTVAVSQTQTVNDPAKIGVETFKARELLRILVALGAYCQMSIQF